MRFLLAATAALLVAAPAAAGTASAAAQELYRQERAACFNGTSNQDRATCLKEAGAALQEARRGNNETAAEAQLARNRVARCAKLPAPDRDECVMRMSQGTATGSALQGGVLRTLEQPVAPK
ncbi:MAG: hypothetical protein HY854_01400 [Burkholderiales bacterium]|nr:hypothetical protein [Burkholderiales bacterium]